MSVKFSLKISQNWWKFCQAKTTKSIALQVNLFQKLATSAEHVVYQNCSECQNKTKTTICVHNMFCRDSEITISINNEQSVVILWVSWCKNKSFWQRFTCTRKCSIHSMLLVSTIYLLYQFLPRQAMETSLFVAKVSLSIFYTVSVAHWINNALFSYFFFAFYYSKV